MIADWDLLIGISAWAPVQAETWSAKIWALMDCKTYLSSQSLSDPQWPSSAVSSSDPYEVRPKQASWQVSCNTVEAGCPPWGLSFPTRGAVGLGEPSWCTSVMAWVRGFSYLCHAVCLGLCCPGGMSAPSSGSGISTMVSRLWIAASWFFGKGTEVRSDLCHHHDDVTSLNFYIRKKERSPINNLSFHLKKQENEEQSKSKARRK